MLAVILILEHSVCAAGARNKIGTAVQIGYLVGIRTVDRNDISLIIVGIALCAVEGKGKIIKVCGIYIIVVTNVHPRALYLERRSAGYYRNGCMLPRIEEKIIERLIKFVGRSVAVCKDSAKLKYRVLVVIQRRGARLGKCREHESLCAGNIEIYRLICACGLVRRGRYIQSIGGCTGNAVRYRLYGYLGDLGSRFCP